MWGVRFFACVPITSPKGAHIGILAVLDSEPRTLTSDQNKLLAEFSHVIADAIVLRLETAMMRRTARQAERSRLHLQKRMDRMISSLPLPLLAVDQSGTILSWNRASADRFGYSMEESVGQSMLDLIVQDEQKERIETLISRVYNRRRITGIQLLLKDRQDQAIATSSRLFPFFNPEGQVEACVFIHADAPEQRAVLREVKAQENRVNELEQLKRTILANMSHEIRTPLTSIIGFSDILHEHVDEANQQFTRLIDQSAQQLMETLTAVLDLAQLKSNSLEAHLEPMDVVEHTAKIVTEFEDAAEAKGLKLSMTSADQTEGIAEIDAVCQTRIMRNLVDNAIKYTRKGRVGVHIHSNMSHVTIEVSDTGIGVSKEFLPKIFGEFLQESKGLSRTFQGSGLGLAITRRLVELMGGTIEVESKRGKGSTFTVRYPRSYASIETA